MMVRTRLVWFTFGFGSSTAAITHFVFRDLCNDRHSLSSQLKEKFDALETRVSNLEQPLFVQNALETSVSNLEQPVFVQNSTPQQD